MQRDERGNVLVPVTHPASMSRSGARHSFPNNKRAADHAREIAQRLGQPQPRQPETGFASQPLTPQYPADPTATNGLSAPIGNPGEVFNSPDMMGPPYYR